MTSSTVKLPMKISYSYRWLLATLKSGGIIKKKIKCRNLNRIIALTDEETILRTYRCIRDKKCNLFYRIHCCSIFSNKHVRRNFFKQLKTFLFINFSVFFSFCAKYYSIFINEIFFYLQLFPRWPFSGPLSHCQLSVKLKNKNHCILGTNIFSLYKQTSGLSCVLYCKLK